MRSWPLTGRPGSKRNDVTAGDSSEGACNPPRARVVESELSWATQVLGQAGIDSARGDAEWLLAAVLGIDRGRLLVADGLDDDTRARFRALVARRTMRIPLQHIVGTAAFGPAELAVGPGVFIPRPETELLAEWAVGIGARAGGTATIVDLCSGSGALAIAIATMLPTARLWAVERSPAALEWLRRNVASAPPGVADRITVVAADVTDVEQMRIGLPWGSVDVVVANPPYVPQAATVSPEVAHDPADAVFGGADGMSVITPMLPIIAELLMPGGAMGVEHDDTTSAAVLAAVESVGVFDDVRARDDLAGRPRFVTARRAVSGPLRPS
ncbi:peptide chain release factor N(5)-glutamine methyltransferase [Gordonia sp. SID5947]|uniref:peptide chain release factor N(5)-glutamine methyltransferase n=1 Tax=Gordonia sp. SID5947 TaxID=2690315 RepID=UPI00136ACAAF|nr:peptide chain release factor N(5)-glutamine methyltransferase [Gordonia sp. SID5947]MYR06091.1 peptide chain release factor N(5)-glutamine methyltransferase [Gordonia sp. SID5947]